jgi:hypothetical protein
MKKTFKAFPQAINHLILSEQIVKNSFKGLIKPESQTLISKKMKPGTEQFRASNQIDMQRLYILSYGMRFVYERLGKPKSITRNSYESSFLAISEILFHLIFRLMLLKQPHYLS